jgi:hypothetical protein
MAGAVKSPRLSAKQGENIMFIGVKNVSQKPYKAIHDAVEYGFEAGEIQLLPIHAAEHIINGSQITATGKKALERVDEKNIPEDMKIAPVVTKTSAVMVENISDKAVDLTWDGVIYSFKKGEAKPIPHIIAHRLIKSSAPHGGKPVLAEKKLTAKAKELVEATKPFTKGDKK